jgi:hypothetical protein
MAFILKEKLKGLKNCIREWNRVNYGLVDSKIDKLVEDISGLDVKSEMNGLSIEEVSLRKQLFEEMWHLRISKESVISQRARQNWLRQGDLNTKFFHASVKSRKKRNHISAICIGEEWIETPVLIRQAAVDYFKRQFSAVEWSRPKLDGVLYPLLSEAENQRLIRPFGIDEIEEVVKECDGNKSPGPDGFNFAFIKATWSIIKGDIRIMFDQFHGIASLPKSFASYFIALIPKVHSPFKLGDF